MSHHQRLPVVRTRAHAESFGDLPARIVGELKHRNWTVPGVKLEFRRIGTGHAQRRGVAAVRTANAVMEFTYSGDILRVAAAGLDMNIYWDAEGFSSLGLSYYVGSDWDHDKDEFLSQRHKYHGARDGETCTYLKYEGRCDCPNLNGAIFTGFNTVLAMFQGDGEMLRNALHEHRGVVPPLLVYTTNHYGTDRLPDEGDPLVYHTAVIVSLLAVELQKLLEMIMAYPIPDEQIDIFCEARMDWPLELGSLFAFGTADDVRRIRAGQRNAMALPREDRYGLAPHSYTFLSGCYGRLDYPEIIADGVRRCGLGVVSDTTPLYQLNIPGHDLWDGLRYVIRVQPTSANGIYIADFAARGAPEAWSNLENGHTIADLGMLDTFVPITEYRGGYANPVIVVTRELDFNEVEVVSGPWTQSAPAPPRRRHWLCWRRRRQLTA